MARPSSVLPWPRSAVAVVAAVAAVLGALTMPAAGQPPRRHAARVRSLALSAVGDTILGNTPKLPEHPRRYLAHVRRPLRHDADVVFANLEGTLTDATDSKCDPSASNCYAFRNPPSYADVFADLGFTAVSDANNHSHDFGTAGFRQTRQVLGSADITRSGAPGEIGYLRRAGLRLGVVSFAPYANTANMLDIPAAADLVRRAHRHADVVVVYMHAGAEGTDAQHVTGREEHYLGEDRGNPLRFAHRMVRAGADLVLGSGPHVLRGMEFYRGHLIAYSLGDFANFHNFDRSGQLGDSAILRVRLGPHGAFRSARLVPVLLVDAGRPARGGNAIPTVRRLSRRDFGVRAVRVSRSGQVRPEA